MKKLEGKRIYLCRVTRDDCEILLAWRNSGHIRRNSFSQHKVSRREHIKWFASLLKDKKRITYMIVLRKTNKPIGRIGLKNIDLVHKRAELEKMIGEKYFLGKGYGKEATIVLLENAFRDLRLRRIYSQVLEFNSANINLNKKIGFKIEGRLRNHFYNQGKFYDVLYMGLLKDDFLWDRKQG